MTGGGTEGDDERKHIKLCLDLKGRKASVEREKGVRGEDGKRETGKRSTNASREDGQGGEEARNDKQKNIELRSVPLFPCDNNILVTQKAR